MSALIEEVGTHDEEIARCARIVSTMAVELDCLGLSKKEITYQTKTLARSYLTATKAFVDSEIDKFVLSIHAGERVKEMGDEDPSSDPEEQKE